MTYLEALDSGRLRDHPHRWRYAELCEDPDEFRREGYRKIVVDMATRSYPGAVEQAANALTAIGRFVGSGFATVPAGEQARRLAICRACESFDPARSRCRQCGCAADLKTRLASEHCPLPDPRW